MEALTPIDLLKHTLAELKASTGVDPQLEIEYEKAILVLELIGSNAFDNKTAEPNTKDNSASNHNEPLKEPKSYFEKFMEAQKNKGKEGK